jgi:hypothetical protein
LLGRKGRNRINWNEEVLAVPADRNDLPLHIRRMGKIDEMTINEIRLGVENHVFDVKELEYLVETMAMRVSIFMSNKFYAY